MAKAEKNAVIEFDPSILEGLTAEQIEELYKLTGQSNLVGGDKTPILKVNLSPKADLNGNKVDVGNWVIGQVIKIDGDKKTVENIGIDCGKAPEVIIVKVASQYSFYCESDKNKNCNSQLILERSDVPVGNKHGFVCSSKDNPCPYRAKDADKKLKCSSQQVVYCVVNGTPAMMYVKGESYIPFTDYVKSLGTTPSFAIKTILETEERSKGSNDYFVLQPRKGSAVTAIEFKENFELAKATQKNIEEFIKQQQMKKPQIGYNKPSGNSGSQSFSDAVDADSIEFD